MHGRACNCQHRIRLFLSYGDNLTISSCFNDLIINTIIIASLLIFFIYFVKTRVYIEVYT